jgi:restriction system protein
MDGCEFQKFIGTLFKKLGFEKVEVGPPTADGGIDISMEQDTDVGPVHFKIECKHHPDNSIGRPVVQKLHSAVIHSPTLDKGIIVTSGRFSSGAIKYAEEVGIELIDLKKLKELAGKKGLSLEEQPSLSMDNCFPIAEKVEALNALSDFLSNDLIEFDKGLVKVEKVYLTLLPAYMVDFAINATFSTSVGRIHSTNVSSTIFLDGKDGTQIGEAYTKPLLPFRHKIAEFNEEKLEGIKVTKERDFVKNFEEIKETARETLKRLHTAQLSYFGANNRRYTKICNPSKKDITLREVTRVNLPVWGFSFQVIRNKYAVGGIVAQNTFHIVPNFGVVIPKDADFQEYPDRCMICLRNMGDERYVCGECGAIVCDKDSSDCKICEKVVCKDHTVSKRKYLILSDKYCPECAKSQGITP